MKQVFETHGSEKVIYNYFRKRDLKDQAQY